MASTIIGKSLSIEGTVESDDDIVVHGKVRGRISVKGSLLVEASGIVEADIETRSVEIAGQVTGDIRAREKVEISEGGRAIGDVKAQRILIADGAVFKGNVDMGK